MTSPWPLLPLAGGFLMGVAGLLLFAILSAKSADSTPGSGRWNRWWTIFGFAVGAPVGAWLISLTVKGVEAPPVPTATLLGFVIGLAVAFLARGLVRR